MKVLRFKRSQDKFLDTTCRIDTKPEGSTYASLLGILEDNRPMARPCVLAILLDKSMHVRTAHLAVVWPSTAHG